MGKTFNYETGQYEDDPVDSGNFDWQGPTLGSQGSQGITDKVGDVLGNPIFKAGAGALGGFLNAKAANAPQKFYEENYKSEIARRNARQDLAMPALARSMGYSPTQVLGMAPNPGMAMGSGQGNPYQVTPGSGVSGASKAAGLGGLGLGVASKVAPQLLKTLGLTNPITAGISGGLMLAQPLLNKIHQGQHAANDFVGGVENPFGQVDLPRISQMAATNPQAAAQQFTQAYSNYKRAVQTELAAGGNRAKVAQQSLNNQALHGTVQRLAAQLGVQI